MGPQTERIDGGGDPAGEAAAAAIAALLPDVWRLQAHLVGRAEADDLTQETAERALRAAGEFRGDASLRTWLLAIGARVAADEIRRAARRRRLAAVVGARQQRQAVSPDTAGAVDLQLLLGGLSHERREAFVLTQVLELEYAESAALLGVPIGTIRSRVARARADLIAAMERG